MKSVLRIWLRGIRSALANRVAYRGDFFISLIVMLLFETITPLITLLIYSKTGGRGFPGWNMYEALLIQAIFLLARGIAMPLFFGMVWTIHGQVRNGTFELTLLRPRSAILISMTQDIDIQSFGRFLAGLAFFIYLLWHLPPVSAFQWLSFLILFCFSLMMLFDLAIIMAATLFVWVGNSRLGEIVETLLRFAQYPGSIFSSALQTIMAVIIPISMIALFPAQALLGRPQPMVLFSIVSLLLFTLLSLLFWRMMVRKYTGAGG